MKLLILGAGAMGSLFAAKLAQAGADVTLYNYRENEHTRAIKENGLRLAEGEQPLQKVAFPIITDARELSGGFDVMMCLVKSYATADVLGQIVQLVKPETLVLTLQNGIGNAETLERFVPREQIAVGGTVAGAGITEPGVVARRGWGKTSIGPVVAGQNESRLHELAVLLTASGLHAEVVPDVMAVIWSKLLVNVVYNGLTAVTRLTNGDAVRTETGKELARQLIGEAVEVANAQGIRLLYDNPVDEVIRLGLEQFSANKSSMLTDVLYQRKTEMDAINGAVVALGKRCGIATPYNEMMAQLVQVIEKSYARTVTHI